MPDLWDRLFKTNLPDGDSGIAINGFSQTLYLYASGDLTKGQATNVLQDFNGDPLPASQLQDATLLTDLIDAETDANAVIQKAKKVFVAERIIAVLHLAELGWITKSEGQALLGI